MFFNPFRNDNLRNPDLEAIASLGSWGRNPQNIQTELWRKFETDYHPDKLVQPLHGPGITSMIAPHELFSVFHEKYPHQFEHRFGASHTKLSWFWHQLRRSERGKAWFDAQPHFQDKQDCLHRLIPLVLHLDGGPFTKRQSVMVLSWASPFGVGSDHESVFLIATWIKTKQRPIDHNMEALWSNLGASFNAFANLEYPSRALDGSRFIKRSWRAECKGQLLAPIAETTGEGWGAVHFGAKMDLEAWVHEVRWSDYNSLTPCGLCDANRSDRPWSDLRADALWSVEHKTQACT